MKLKIFLFALIAFTANSQTTYTSSKYKPVWYSSTYEKTHGTYALFDTSSIKLYWTTSGKPEMKFFGPTGNTLFYIDSTGTISTGVTSGGLLKADFDDSLNNAHTITGLWKFGENVAVTNGYAFRSRDNDSDTLNINVKGFSPTNTAATGINAFQLKDGAVNLFSIDTTTGLIHQGNETIDVTADNNFGDNIIIDKTDPTYKFRYGTTDASMTMNSAGTLVYSMESLSNAFSFTSIGRFGLGTIDPQHLASIVGATPILNVVDSDVNKLRNTAAQASDSASFKVDASTAFPAVTLSGGDGDQYTISGNTSDQAVFTGASGGYTFDSYGSFTGGVVINNTAVAPTAISGRMYFQGINNADADTLFFYNGTAWKQFISE